ncbi:hypothetical protein [Paraburkholderia caribensis]|uniref:hypothetical protein n=1 Tax=Paraburkholderia caribensis TaxID=75105 RepID=UPI0007227343|nr:hypothetical protein [Paraburkholderia caribensis]ALP62396.1 hypothetical protein AN416_07145 [Paraburkholderia caribensis]AUT52377.1 hypothetical protein C2L66_11275 [Paraburkholderia caribensis]
MPYVLAKNPTFKAKVMVVEPGNTDDGAVEASEFTAEFKRLKRDEAETLMKANQPVYVALADVLVGWSGLKGDDGGELPFSAEYRDALLQIPHAVVALWDTFLQGTSGATRKN